MVRKDGSMVETEAVCLGPEGSEKPVPADKVSEDLRKIQDQPTSVRTAEKIQTDCGRRIYEGYVT